MKVRSKGAIFLGLLIFVSIKSIVYSQMYGLDQYGFIIGDQCGQIIESEFANDHLSIHIAFPERKTLCGQLQGNTLSGTFQGQSYTMIFNADGTGKGKLKDGTDLLMVRGEQIKPHESETTLDSLQLLEEFHESIQKSKISMEDVIGCYLEKDSNSALLTLILKGDNVASKKQHEIVQLDLNQVDY